MNPNPQEANDRASMECREEITGRGITTASILITEKKKVSDSDRKKSVTHSGSVLTDHPSSHCRKLEEEPEDSIARHHSPSFIHQCHCHIAKRCVRE